MATFLCFSLEVTVFWIAASFCCAVYCVFFKCVCSLDVCNWYIGNFFKSFSDLNGTFWLISHKIIINNAHFQSMKKQNLQFAINTITTAVQHKKQTLQ